MTTKQLQNFKETTTHLIIQFINNNEEGLRSVEHVPRSWLKNVNHKWHCFYPDKRNYRFIEKWCEQNKAPDVEIWPEYEVIVLKEARKLKY